MSNTNEVPNGIVVRAENVQALLDYYKNRLAALELEFVNYQLEKEQEIRQLRTSNGEAGGQTATESI